MQKFLTKLLVVASLLLCLPAFAQSTPAASSDVMPGVVRVKLQKSVARNLGPSTRRAARGKTLTTGIEAFDASLKQIHGVELRKVFPCPPGREAEHALYGLDQWYEVVFDESVNPMEARRVLGEVAGVERAHTRRPLKFFGTEQATPVDIKHTAKAPAKMPFNDPRLPQQWHYHNDGSMPGSVKGMDINLFEAWKVTTGSDKVVVAVIDGGIDVTHEDLVDALWVNKGEIPGNGIDDDGNGFVDDVYGFNFCTNDGDVAAHDHGTHVAGTIGAVNNNATGVAGVAGGDGTPGTGVRLMSVQVFDSRSGSGWADFARAIVYAADMGATIANCSWGWDDDGYYEQDVLDAIVYFTRTARSSNMTGGLCIFAAGNTGEQGDFYPQCMDEVLTVGSISFDGRLTTYNSYGPWVDLCAPGGLLDYNTSEGVLSTTPGNTYSFMQGTSMAAPHVTGIAALILSKYGSTSLTNGALRTQLETSLNELYTLNPGLEGLYGQGYIDAAKALMWGDGTPPGTPANISLLAAQDNITIQWIIPESSDNNVNNHILYYSNTPFDAGADLSKINSVVIDTKYCSSGDSFSYELTGLEPLTTYYLAIKAVDRWGNSSPLSEVLSVATNRGPKMDVDVTSSINITSDAAHRVARGSFNISNSDEGLLKWSAYLRNRTHSISSYSAPGSNVVSKYNGTVGIRPYASENQLLQVTDYNRDDYPKEFTNMSSLRSFIGDIDPEVPNSMAQLFTVDPKKFPDGFNLTAVNIAGAHGDDAIIEIYRGPNMMSEQTKLLEYIPPYFSYYSNISLDEQLFFEPGESFYIVVHFPVPQAELYPLCIGYHNGSTAATSAYMSNDMGKTWVLLTQALKGSAFEADADKCCWAITAVSQNPDFSSLITLEPAEGRVASQQSAKVDVVADGNYLINGTYRANIHFRTNESETNDIVVPVTVNVKDRKPDISFTKVVDFGSLIIGQSKTITIEVFNRGYGNFGNTWGQLGSNDIRCTNDQFKAPTFLGNGFPARSTTTFDITYTPTVAGSQSGQVIFTASDGSQLKLMLQGTATEAAKIEIQPSDRVDAGALEVGGSEKEVGFSIANTGKYPLQWYMPKFTDERIEGITAESDHRFGYIWESNLDGATQIEYQPMPELNEPVNVASMFSDYNYYSNAIDLGFDFPYFGKTYSEAYITCWGGVCFHPYTEGSIYGPLDENRDYYLKGCGWISAFGSNQLMMSPSSKVEYAHLDGRFVINFRDVLASVYDKEYTPISFHMVLDPSGDVEIYYDSFTPANLFGECRGLFVALVDEPMEDPIVVTSDRISNNPYGNPNDWTERGNLYKKFGSGTAVRFVAPKANFINSVAPVIGVVAPGESVEIKARLQANDEMNGGDTFNNIQIVTNDPDAQSVRVRIDATITGDLNPEVTVNPARVDFGNVFRTAVVKKAVTVKNTGRAPMTLSPATLANGNFDIDFTSAIEIPAGQSKDINLMMHTEDEGPVADRLTITTSAGEVNVDVVGTVIGCPAISLGYDNLDETLDYGISKPAPLTLSNTGNAPMAYTVSVGDLIKYEPLFLDNSKVTYKYAGSVDDPSIKTEWVDIETNGLGTLNNIMYYVNNDYVEVDLPFEFPFYDKKYSKMYIYNTGFISFTHRKDDKIWPEPPLEFPAGSLYNNLLAPLWGNHSMDETPTAGTYYYVTDDHAIVSFMQYGNSMNAGVCFQVELRNDGSFTYRYKGYNEYSNLFTLFGVVGISNIDGSQGLNLPERMVTFGSTIDFLPVVENTLPAGQSVDVDLTLVANRLAGEYESSIQIDTDIPAQSSYTIPVKMTILGHAEPHFPSDMVVEHPLGYSSQDYSDWWIAQGARYYQEFEVSNSGSAAFTVESIEFSGYGVSQTPWNSKFILYYYGEQEDWFGNISEGWYQYSPSVAGPIEVGTKPLRLCVPMLPNGPYNVGDYELNLKYNISGLDDITSVNHKLTYRITQAPTMKLSKDEIRVVNAVDDKIFNESVRLSNTGRYRLDYDYYLDITGLGEQIKYPEEGTIEPLNVAMTPAAKVTLPAVSPVVNTIKPMDTGASDNFYDTPQSGNYTNFLYWPCRNDSGFKGYSWGAGDTYNEFVIATQYTGPEEGFNIAAIYILVAPYNLNGKDIKAEIVNGDVTISDDVLGSGVYTIADGQYQDGQLAFAVIRLNRNVYISPGQQFYVKITYPAGSPRVTAIVSKADFPVEGRYLAYLPAAGWADAGVGFNDSYGSMGYVCTCLETVPGQPWVTLTSTNTEGSLQPGEAIDINVQLSGASAPKESGNKAVIVFHSNDPDNQLVNFPIYLDRNSAPKITPSLNNISVDEGTVEEVEILIADPDGDDFAIRLDDNHPNTVATIKSVELVNPATGAQANEYDKQNHFWEILGNPDGIRLIAQIAPRHGDAGDYSFTVSAIDSQRNLGDATVNYVVNHVNRAPIATAVDKVNLKINQLSQPINLSETITDPDGDQLEFAVQPVAVPIGCIRIYRAGNNMIVEGLHAGSARVTITATDPDGLSASTTIEVAVSSEVSVDEISLDANATVWPNPMVEFVDVTLDFDSADVNYRLYTIGGALMINETASARAGEPHRLSVGHLVPGPYILAVDAAGRHLTRVMVKN